MKFLKAFVCLMTICLLNLSGGLCAQESETVKLAEQAIESRYKAKAIEYEKVQAERTIRSSKSIIQSSEKSIPQARKAVAQAEKDLAAAKKTLDEKTDLAAKTETKAKSSGTDQDKSAAAKAGQERIAAERTFKQKEYKVRTEREKLKRTEDRLQNSQQELAEATKNVPLKEAAAKEQHATADTLREKALEAARTHAARQTPLKVAARIDELINAKLKSAEIESSPEADDGEFLRRATLDITGAVPAYEDVLAFLDSSDPEKREQLIDSLLEKKQYGQNFSQRFCTLSTETGTTTLTQAQDYFNEWLAESLNLNRRWDQLAREMMSAEGHGYENPAALFSMAYRMNEQPDASLLLGAAGDMFLGLQIKCAQCHDHPFHEWTQDEFWQMAAMFGRTRVKGSSQNGRELDFLLTDHDVDEKELVRMNGIKYPKQFTNGQIEIPDPVNPGEVLKTVPAAFLSGEKPELPEKGNYRIQFADWVTADENPYFARATVNRLWAHFFGRGLVAQLDNLHPDNEPSHPELLELLANEFRTADYDLKYLIRIIMNTKAYQRSSRPKPGNIDDHELLSHMAVKPLDSFAMVDSLWVILRRNPPDPGRRRDAAAVFDTRLPGADPTKYTHSIPQVLKLMNTRDHAQVNSTVQVVTQSKSPEEAVAHLFLAVLARRPSETESQRMTEYIKDLGDQRQGYADVFWVLVNSAEFLINH